MPPSLPPHGVHRDGGMCSPDPNQWKIVTAVHGSSCVTFDGSSVGFALDFITNRQFMDEAGNP